MNRCRRLVIQLLVSAFALTTWQLSAEPASNAVVSVHWLGLDRIAADTNSARFISVWRLPQTTALVNQALDKLSRWSGHGATNAASRLLRPLLDDLISSEFYVEICTPTNSLARRSDLPRRSETQAGAKAAQLSTNPQPSTLNLQLLFALRLPPDRARLWQTNLFAAVEFLAGDRPNPTRNGWLLSQSNAPNCIEFIQIGEWTLIGIGPDTNNSLSGFVDHIVHDQSSTNSWLEADFALARLMAFLQFSSLDSRPSSAKLDALISHSSLSHVHIVVAGAAGNVLTRGTLDLARPLESPLPQWEVPTNYIHEPLTSFTAARGFASWLAALPAWQNLGLTPPPDEFYLWAPSGAPFQTYFAAPLPSATNQLRQLAARLVQSANPCMATNDEGFIKWQTNPPALIWIGAAFLSPHLTPIAVKQREFVLGGLEPLPKGDTNSPPSEIGRDVLDARNIVFYEFEHTYRRIDDDLFTSQLFRVMFHKPELPRVAAVWLKALEPLMEDTTTVVTQTDPQQLTLTRTSTVGLTAFELHLLADWLESPYFPYGLHTFADH